MRYWKSLVGKTTVAKEILKQAALADKKCSIVCASRISCEPYNGQISRILYKILGRPVCLSVVLVA